MRAILMERIKALGLVLFTAIVIFFAVQNQHTVPVGFLLWDFSISVALITFVSLLVGLLIGLAFAALLSARRALAERRAAPPDQPSGPGRRATTAEMKDAEEIPH
jgi:uncharacterized integral membrane protein